MDHTSEPIDAVQSGHSLLQDQMCNLARFGTRSNACMLSRTQHIARIREHWANLYSCGARGHLRIDNVGAAAPTT